MDESSDVSVFSSFSGSPFSTVVQYPIWIPVEVSVSRKGDTACHSRRRRAVKQLRSAYQLCCRWLCYPASCWPCLNVRDTGYMYCTIFLYLHCSVNCCTRMPYGIPYRYTGTISRCIHTWHKVWDTLVVDWVVDEWTRLSRSPTTGLVTPFSLFVPYGWRKIARRCKSSASVTTLQPYSIQNIHCSPNAWQKANALVLLSLSFLFKFFKLPIESNAANSSSSADVLQADSLDKESKRKKLIRRSPCKYLTWTLSDP